MHWSEIALVIIGVLLIIGCIGGIIYFYRYNNNKKKGDVQFINETATPTDSITTKNEEDITKIEVDNTTTTNN